MLFELERGVTKVTDIKSINITNRRVVHVKKIKKICISCLLTLCIFIPNIAVFALNIPSDNIAVQSVLVDGIQVTNTPSMVEEGTGFFMNDGSVAICCSHGLPAPSQGVGYYIDRSLGSSYRDGDLWYDTPTDWTFRCLYYADKLDIDLYEARESCCGPEYKELIDKWIPKEKRKEMVSIFTA